MPLRREVTYGMHFTKGRRRKYERLMQEKPGFGRREAEEESDQSCIQREKRRKADRDSKRRKDTKK